MVGVESLESIWGKTTSVPFAADASARLQPCPNADLLILQNPHDVTTYTFAVSYDYKGSICCFLRLDESSSRLQGALDDAVN